MRNFQFEKAIILFVSMLLVGCNDKKAFSYIFEVDNISTVSVEYACSFSSSGRVLYFARSSQKWGMEGMKSSVYYAIRENGKWSTPEIAFFSGQYDDSDPHLTQDGNTLYFISKRPSGDIPVSADIWMVKKDAGGQWGEPIRLPYPINSEETEYSPSTDGDGNLYFASDRPGGYGQGDIYVCQIKNAKLSSPKNIGNSINSSTGEWNLEINHDGNLLIFEASQRKQNVSSYGDLYISFKHGNIWTIPQNIEELNTSGSDLYPYLTQDESRLYYTSSDSLKGQNTNIYFAEFDQLYNKYKHRAKIPLQYLLVVNRSSHDLALINLSNQKLVNSIPVGIGPHEVCISKDNKYAYVANYGSYPNPHEEPITNQQLKWIEELQNTITKVDLSNLETETFTIHGSFSHHGILTNYDGSIFWTTAENEGVVKEINGTNGVILKEYTTMPGSHILRSSQDFSKIFVSNIESNTISVIDREIQIVTNIKTPKGPEGMEISPDGKFLWVLCNNANKIMILNTHNLTQVKTFDSDGKFPIKLAFVGDEAWVANVFSQSISIFNAYTFNLKERIELESSPLGIISDNERVFITLPRKNIVRVYDSKSRKKLSEYSHGMEQDGLFHINDIEGIIGE